MPETMPCQTCTDGIETVTYLVGDGQPGVPTRVESEERECRDCGGTGEIPDPEAE